MSLSEDERAELERLRRSYRRRRTHDDAGGRALGLSLLYLVIQPWLTKFFGVSQDSLFWKVGVIVCFASGFLSSYYGPFKRKKAEGVDFLIEKVNGGDA